MAVRYGTTVGNRSVTLGLWKDSWREASDDSPIGQFARVRAETMRVAQRLHEQGQELEIAKRTNRPAQIPEPEIRLKLARTEQAKLKQLQDMAFAVEQSVADREVKLRPYDYSKDGVVGAMQRQELRSYLRGAKDDRSRMAMFENHH